MQPELDMAMLNRYLLMIACLLPMETWAREGATLVERWTRDPLYSICVLILVAGFVLGFIRERPVYAFASIALVLVLWMGPVLIRHLDWYVF